MSLEQAKSFAQGLKQLSEGFREDSRTTTEMYVEKLEGASKEIVEGSHVYAKTMVERANQYTEDIQALYKDIYEDEDDDEADEA